MGTLTIADELALLAYDDDGSAQLGHPELDYGLAGAVLVELALADRVLVENNRVVVVNPTPIGQPHLDEALARIAGSRRPRQPKYWVETLSRRLPERVLDGLAAAGVLRRENDKILGIFPRTRYPSPYAVEPPAETDVRQRLTAAIQSEGPVEPRVAALCALVRAVRLDKRLFADLPRGRVKARLTEIAAGEWAAEATKRAIEEMEAAVMVAVMVPIVASNT